MSEKTVSVVDLLPEFIVALTQQLMEDELRHSNTWLELDRENQIFRIRDRFDEYFQEWVMGGGHFGPPYPWLKVAGNAFIAWIRDSHPELSEHWE